MRPGRAMLVACLLGTGACRSVVRGDLEENQANELVLALDGAGVSATKAAESGALSGRFRVEVPRALLPRALQSLQQQGLPRPEPPGFEQLYAEASLVPTPQDERARWLVATSAELSRSLRRLPGVADARVHLALGLGVRALDDAPRPHKASVLLRVTRKARTLEDAAVQKLVAGAVDGLQPADVEVLRAPVPEQQSSAARLVQVGPADVSVGSAPMLRALLAGALALDILMAGALVLVWRLRR